MLRLFDLTAEKQKVLIEYVFSRCNMCSFHVPSFQHSKGNNTSVAKKDDGNLDEDFILQNNMTLSVIKDLRLEIIRTTNQSEYGQQKFGYVSKVYYFKPNNSFKLFLSDNHFTTWTFPNLPEDPILYVGKTPLLEFVSHEGIAWLHSVEKMDKCFLNDATISFREEVNP